MNRIIDIKTTESSPTEPVTLVQAKAHLLIDHTADDTYVTSLITQCRRAVENACNIAIVQKVVVLTADWEEEWELPVGPHGTISEVKLRTGTVGGIAEYQTLDADDEYTTDGELFKLFNSSSCGRHKITYTAGYSTVPDDLKLAILNEIAFRYENRGDSKDGLCAGAAELIKPYINYSWY